MGKIALALLFVALQAAMPFAWTMADDPKTIESWYEKLYQAKPKLTRLRFYYHDTISGKNSTSFTVAQASFTNQSDTFFGLLNMFDDPLTEGPEPSSRSVGRAQGIYAGAGLESVSLLMNMNILFTNEKYNGSTLSIMGRNAAFDPSREMPIVGGSGVFRLAHGTAMVRTYKLDMSTGNGIAEYNLIVMHY